MNIHTFHTDWHIGSTMQLKGVSIDQLDPKNEKEWLLGDMFDLANCKKSMVKTYLDLFLKFRVLFGRRFLTGNHECYQDFDQFEWVNQKRGIACMHGDCLFWTPERSEKYRSREHGAGFLKRFFWVNAIEALEHGWGGEPKEDALERFDRFVDHHDIRVLISGHKHPSKVLKIERNGKTWIILPRGTTLLDLDTL